VAISIPIATDGIDHSSLNVIVQRAHVIVLPVIFSYGFHQHVVDVYPYRASPIVVPYMKNRIIATQRADSVRSPQASRIIEDKFHILRNLCSIFRIDDSHDYWLEIGVTNMRRELFLSKGLILNKAVFVNTIRGVVQFLHNFRFDQCGQVLIVLC